MVFVGRAMRVATVTAMAAAIMASVATAADRPETSVDVRTKGDIRAEHGSPDAFAVYFFDEASEDGSVAPMRLERWSYYRDGIEFSFADDQVVAEDPMKRGSAAEAEPVPYDPDQFSAYMRLDEVLVAAGLDEYLGGPVDELVKGGELYFADRLTWGIKDGELRYIEAVALESVAAGSEVE